MDNVNLIVKINITLINLHKAVKLVISVAKPVMEVIKINAQVALINIK